MDPGPWNLPEAFYTTTAHQHDDYWKVSKYPDLTKENIRQKLGAYPVPKSAKKKVLFEALYRKQLGLPSYHSSTNDELRKFIKHRKIDASAVIKGKTIGTRNELVKLLESADSRRTFPKFLDLPPELRNRIYELHFSDMRTAYAPTQPPITRSSRLLRQESLGLFYATCRFTAVVQKSSRNTWTRELHTEHPLRLRFASHFLLWMKSTPANYTGNITKIELRMLTRVGAVVSSAWNCEEVCKVDFSRKEVVMSDEWTKAFRGIGANAKVDEVFGKVVKKDREEGWRLGEWEWEEFLRAFEEMWNSPNF